MVRIPKVDASVGLSIANQPNIPISYGTDVGKAMQQLGRGISKFGSGLEGAVGHDNENADLEERLEQLKAENNLDNDFRTATGGYNIDRDDPNEWQRRQQEMRQKRYSEYNTKVAPPRDKRQSLKRQIWQQQNENRYASRARTFVNGKVQQRAVNGVETAISGEYQKMGQVLDPNSAYYIHPSDPDYAAKYVERLRTIQQGADLIINKLNAPESQKSALRKKSAMATAATLAHLAQSGGATHAYEVAKGLLLGSGAGEPGQLEENNAPPGVGPQDAQAGTIEREASTAQTPEAPNLEEASKRIIQSQSTNARVRRKPISPKLNIALSKALAPVEGVHAEIYSGGQAARGTGGARIGSTRHDDGDAADLRLYRIVDGKKQYLSMNNSEDRKVMEGFVERAVAAGAVGVGAHPEYMGEHSMHIGFGKAAAWGKGKKASGAPRWLKAAFQRGFSAYRRGAASSDVVGGPIVSILNKAAQENGLDPKTFIAFARIESSLRPDKRTGSYKGLLQLSDDQFRKYGGSGDIYDPQANAAAGAKKVVALVDQFKKANGGRAPNATELYLMHQQGVEGQKAHYANPDGKAWQNIRKYYKSERIAKKAIWGNLTPEAKRKFGSVEKVSSGDFIAFWDQRVKEKGGADASPSAVPTRPYQVADASGNTPPPTQASLSPEVTESLRRMMPTLERENQKAIEIQRHMGRVKQYVTGELTFNRFDADSKKYVDYWADKTKAGERLLQGDQSTIGMIVMTSKTLNYVPKPWAETLRTMAMSKDPRQQGTAYETAASILTSNPNALEGDGLKRLREEAQTYRAFTATGDKPEEAMARMAEMKTEEWEKRNEAFKGKLEGRNGLLANIDEDEVETALGDTVTIFEEDPSLNPARKELILVEYKELFSYHYMRTGKEDAAHKLAGEDMQRVYGRSSATGQSMFMRYPPEKSYPPIGNTGHQYLQDDLKRSVTNYLHMKRIQEQGVMTPPGIGPDTSEPPEIDMDNVTIQFIENKTSERIAGGKLPYYRVIYNDPNTGIPIVLPGAWGLNDEHIKAYQDAYIAGFDERRQEFLRKTDQERSNDSSPSMWLRRQLPQFMQDFATGMDERPEPVIIPRKK